jgi:predicted DNA-binding WGR domain protein
LGTPDEYAVIKLYKRNRTGGCEYHEAWVSGGAVVEHWGRLGTRGESKHHHVDASSDETASLESVLAAARARGFEEIDDDDHHVLLVEYVVDGMGSSRDLEKRHALESRLSELLGWTGLGHCDGGSIGSGTMEACCFVVDFALARDLIEKDLRGSEFGDYARIFEEGSD